MLWNADRGRALLLQQIVRWRSAHVLNAMVTRIRSPVSPTFFGAPAVCYTPPRWSQVGFYNGNDHLFGKICAVFCLLVVTWTSSLELSLAGETLPTGNGPHAIANEAVSTSVDHGVHRGVCPEALALYKGAPGAEFFVCLSGQLRIPLTAVNDDYCDCPDGSDEPGTSACSGAEQRYSGILYPVFSQYEVNRDSDPYRQILDQALPTATGHGEMPEPRHTLKPSCLDNLFYCPNPEFIPKQIPLSFVNDGICDCCDGSDEWRSSSCSNTCEEAALQWRLEQERLAKDLAEGLRLRDKYIVEGNKAVAQWKSELATLQETLASQKAALAEAEGPLSNQLENETPNRTSTTHADEEVEAETSENDEEEETPSEYTKWALRDGIDQTAEDNEEISGGEKVERSPLIENSGTDSLPLDQRDTGTRSNLDDMKTWARSKIVEPLWQFAKQLHTKSSNYASPIAAAARRLVVSLQHAKRFPRKEIAQDLRKFHYYDALLGMFTDTDSEREDTEDDSEESTDFEGGQGELWDVYKRIKSGLSVIYKSVSNILLDVCQLALPREKDLATSSVAQIQSAVWQTQNSIRNLEQQLNLHMGLNNEFYPLTKQCVTAAQHGFSYNICFFGTVMQKAGKHKELIGRYSSLSVEKDDEGQDVYVMKFTNGNLCPGGVARHLDVAIICGTSLKALEITEPTLCTYTAKVQFPGACKSPSKGNGASSEQAANTLQGSTTDEL